MDKDTKLSVPMEQVQVIKDAFRGNESLLKAVRAVLLGLEVTPEERNEVTYTFSDTKVVKVIKERLNPQMDKNAQFGQLKNAWSEIVTSIVGQHPDTIKQHLTYNVKRQELMAKGIESLSDPQAPKVDLTYSVDNDDELATTLIAREQYIKHVDTQIMFLRVIAEQESETEVKKKKEQDSTK